MSEVDTPTYERYMAAVWVVVTVEEREKHTNETTLTKSVKGATPVA